MPLPRKRRLPSPRDLLRRPFGAALQSALILDPSAPVAKQPEERPCVLLLMK